MLRAQARFDAFPDVADATLARYLRDVVRYPVVTQDLPCYDGPALLLNGENDIQTPVAGARLADAALAAAGRRDHALVVFPGLGHAMNPTLKYAGTFGDPAPEVLRTITTWLRARTR